MNIRILFGAVWCLAFACTSAQAVDGVSVEVGYDGGDMARVGMQWDWNRQWFQGAAWHVGAYWDLTIGRWRRNWPPGFKDGIGEIGLTPVFRLQPNELKGPYLEGGIGMHLLSQSMLADKRFGTRFQFGEHVGVGFRFGATSAFDLGYRFQHLSNADIKRPNNGINFHQVRLQYHF